METPTFNSLVALLILIAIYKNISTQGIAPINPYLFSNVFLELLLVCELACQDIQYIVYLLLLKVN